jgi:hypothetical protein
MSTVQTASPTVVRIRPQQQPAAVAEPGRRQQIAARVRRSGLPLVRTLVGGVVISLLGELAIGRFSHAVLGVSDSFKMLTPPDVVPVAFGPVVGCSVVFALVFMLKRPTARSKHLLVTAGIKFALLNGLIAFLTLSGPASAATIATVLVAVTYPILYIPALLRFVPRADA